MALRRAVILLLTLAGSLCLVWGTNALNRPLTTGASLFLLAYIYAQLTLPKGPR